MKMSVWPNMSQPPAEVFDTARWAEAAGWYGVWYADHYMSNTGSTEIERGDAHECWAMLPAIAMATERVRIGSLVAPTSVHHPAVIANRAITIDHISNGRMVLGLGAGWQINEHHAYGIELEPPKQRVDRFDEAIQIVRSLLDNDVTDFDGSVYRMTGAIADPKPIQSPLPILVGTAGRRMLRITARYADEWNAWGDVDAAPRPSGARSSRHVTPSAATSRRCAHRCSRSCSSPTTTPYATRCSPARWATARSSVRPTRSPTRSGATAKQVSTSSSFRRSTSATPPRSVATDSRRFATSPPDSPDATSAPTRAGQEWNLS